MLVWCRLYWYDDVFRLFVCLVLLLLCCVGVGLGLVVGLLDWLGLVGWFCWSRLILGIVYWRFLIVDCVVCYCYWWCWFLVLVVVVVVVLFSVSWCWWLVFRYGCWGGWWWYVVYCFVLLVYCFSLVDLIGWISVYWVFVGVWFLSLL